MSTAPGFVGTATDAQRLAESQTLQFRALAKSIGANIRVAMPGVIESFNPETQTATVDVAIYDKIQTGLPSLPNYSPTSGDIKIPTLLDVPVLFPGGGGWTQTFPVAAGDECLVVFADMCINEWFDAGGINNVQQVLRRHDLSDGFAIVGFRSGPKQIESFNTTGPQITSPSGDTTLAMQEGKVAITATEIDLSGLLALTGVSVPSVSSPSISLPVKLNGVTYYLKLSATP